MRLGPGADLGTTALAGRHWQINGHWQYDPDPAHASEIEVRFSADGPEQTRSPAQPAGRAERLPAP